MSEAELTLGQLRLIVRDYPGAPKWWIGDWANEGFKRFGVSLEDATRIASSGAEQLRPFAYSSSLALPAGVRVDGTSLHLPERLERDQWALVGAFLLRAHAELPGTNPRRLRFRFSDVFPADELLSEWLATVSMAANDLIAVHIPMLDASDPSLRWYFFRASVGHYYEVAKHLEETEELPEVKALVASLPMPARDSYDTTLSLFKENPGAMSKPAERSDASA